MGIAQNLNYLKPHWGQELTHALRYYLSRAFVEPEDIVLDLGCGYGYGSCMLATVAKEVIVFDIEGFFLKQYERTNIKFKKVDLRNYSLPEADVIVAIEFLEHTECPREIINEIKIKAGKFIILSYPRRPTTGLDFTHLSNLIPEEVKAWIEDNHWVCIFEHIFGLSLLQVFKNYGNFRPKD